MHPKAEKPAFLSTRGITQDNPGNARTNRDEAPPLISGEPIPVGSPDRRGPLSAGLSSRPVGAAAVFGSAQPDLFVVAGRHSSRPGLYLYRWLATAPGGAPVFGERVRVDHPFGDMLASGKVHVAIVQTGDGVIHGVWLKGNELIHSVYDAGKRSFIRDEGGPVSLDGLPRPGREIAVMLNPDGSLEVLISVPDGVRAQPGDYDWRDERYRPYDGAGIWRGGLPYVSMYGISLPGMFSGPATGAQLVSETERETGARARCDRRIAAR